MSEIYQVFSPWADVDPQPLKGISNRLSDLKSKTIGLFVYSSKVASLPVQAEIEQKLKQKYSDLKTSWFFHDRGEIRESEKAELKKWLKQLDGVIAGYSD